METKEAKGKVIKLDADYLRSRTLEGVLKTYHARIDREEIRKQWEAANKR
ncbi:MAG: hypothetical protein ACKO96_37000 [Flammeovirgaceae bacterium]